MLWFKVLLTVYFAFRLAKHHKENRKWADMPDDQVVPEQAIKYLIGILLWAFMIAGIWIWLPSPKAEAPQPVATAEAAYAFPDPCGLSSVECPEEKTMTIQDYDAQVEREVKATCDMYPEEPCMGLVTVETSLVVDAIARIETSSGQAGVGKSKNNPTGIKCGSSYCSYDSYEDGLNASMDLWQKYYADLPLDDALAKWKTGSRSDRSPATVAYISLVGSLITQ